MMGVPSIYRGVNDLKNKLSQLKKSATTKRVNFILQKQIWMSQKSEKWTQGICAGICANVEVPSWHFDTLPQFLIFFHFVITFSIFLSLKMDLEVF